MELYFQTSIGREYNVDGLDLDDVWSELETEDEQSLFESLVCHVAQFAIDQNVRFGEVVGMTFDADGDEVEITETPDDSTWIREVAQLVTHIKSNKHYAPDGAIFGRIKDLGWEYVDFSSDLETMENEYSQEYGGDPDEFAREEMDALGQSIDEEIDRYFDYDSYGESLLDGYDRVEWAGSEYLFQQ